MFFYLIGAVIVGGLIGWVSERFGLTANGYAPSIVTGIGGAIIAFFVLALFGIGFGGRTMTAAVGAALALFLAPLLRKR